MSETDLLPKAGESSRRPQYGTISNENNSTDDTGSQPSFTSSIYNRSDSTTSTVDMSIQMSSTLNLFEKVGFGLGHVYNDLAAGVWFSYTLLFLQGALSMSATTAGSLVMLGQVGDALATPVVGILADKYGTKRGWHIAGTIMVFLTFPLIFSLCPWCIGSPWIPLVYFATCILVFQFGWATVQITHLAMIPELSRTQKDRSDLTAIRYSSGVCSNVLVYCVMWAVLHGGKMKTKNNITPEDTYRFRDISLILTLVGLSMVVLFHFSLAMSNYEQRRRHALANSGYSQTVKPSVDADNNAITNGENHLARSSSTSSVEDNDIRQPLLVKASNDATEVKNRDKNFLKSPLLYLNSLLYVFSRLFMTTSLIYIPLWLDERSFLPAGFGSEFPQYMGGNLDDATSFTALDPASVERIATVPLVSFLASFVSSMLLKTVRRRMGHKVGYFVGSTISLSACSWVLLAPSSTLSTFQLYGIATLFGAGSSITMISSLSITADMIGRHAGQAGFIYSAVTFADKLITGIAVVIIESIKCKDRKECPEYYRSVLAFACGFASLFGLATLSILICTNVYSRRKRHSQRSQQTSQVN